MYIFNILCILYLIYIRFLKSFRSFISPDIIKMGDREISKIRDMM